PAAEKWTPFRNSLSGETGEFYFGTFGENSSGIDSIGAISCFRDCTVRRASSTLISGIADLF
ncbi:hypothetical protein, partial [Mesorhizobium sp. M0678]|uniref:hypothetical protein n=1 Tax=Mesorhizobium sp. M0678 TaxID=2956985 RepID=UPI00333CD14A